MHHPLTTVEVSYLAYIFRQQYKAVAEGTAPHPDDSKGPDGAEHHDFFAAKLDPTNCSGVQTKQFPVRAWYYRSIRVVNPSIHPAEGERILSQPFSACFIPSSDQPGVVNCRTYVCTSMYASYVPDSAFVKAVEKQTQF